MKLAFNPKVLCIVIKCYVKEKKNKQILLTFIIRNIVKRILGLQGLTSNLRKLLSVWDSGNLPYFCFSSKCLTVAVLFQSMIVHIGSFFCV